MLTSEVVGGGVVVGGGSLVVGPGSSLVGGGSSEDVGGGLSCVVDGGGPSSEVVGSFEPPDDMFLRDNGEGEKKKRQNLDNGFSLFLYQQGYVGWKGYTRLGKAEDVQNWLKATTPTFGTHSVTPFNISLVARQRPLRDSMNGVVTHCVLLLHTATMML